MAKLHELTTGFIESFLRNNPKSLVDSNGFLRSEYEAEIARRAQPVTEPLGVPDPRTYRPQFECTGEALPEFETPDEQLGIAASELPPDVTAQDLGVNEQPEPESPTIEQQLTAPLVLTTTPAPPIAEGAQRLRIVDEHNDHE